MRTAHLPERDTALLASRLRHPAGVTGCADCDADGAGRFVPCWSHRSYALIRTYVGTPSSHGAGDVVVVEQVLSDGELLASWTLHPVGALRHCGYGWGYGGAGPTLLARSLLTDALGVDPPQFEVVAFRESVIEGLDRLGGFGLSRADVLSWIYDYRGHKGGSALAGQPVNGTTRR